MISYETHILPNSDYYVYTPSTLAKKLFSTPSVSGLFVMKAVTVWHAILTTVF